MDLLLQIKNKIKSNPDWNGARGIESILTHIEIAERHHERAKLERDEHLYTDAIYRTNHAFEGILKEAYVLLSNHSADSMSPYQIEEYLLANNALRPRVVDQLKNYRQNWRNPSTHDYQLFFSEQESFLAITSVSAFVSILLDQMLERAAYVLKLKALENSFMLARDRIEGYDTLTPIDKVWRLLVSFSDHYIANYEEMSTYSRSTTNAQLAAFVEKVAPDLTIEQEVRFMSNQQTVFFDMIISHAGVKVAVETHEPSSRNPPDVPFSRDAAMTQLQGYLRLAGLTNGVLFYLPGGANEVPIATTASTSWPKDLHLREVYGEDKDEVESWREDEEWDREEEAVSLVNEQEK